MNATVNNSVLQCSNNRTYNFIAEPSVSFYVRVVLFAFIMLGSVLGNAVVCKAILSLPTRQLLFSYYLVTNLAAAEIISSLCFPFYFVYDWLNHWPFGDIACKLVFPIQMTAMFVVTYTLAFIAVYRYRVIVFKCHQLASRSLAKVLLVLGLLWGAGLTIVLPVGVMHNQIRVPCGENHCRALFPGDTYNDAPRHTKYSIARFIVSFIVPYLVILMSYIAVTLKIKTHVAESNTTRTTSDVTGEDPLRQSGHPQSIELQLMEGNACMQKENGKTNKAKYLIGKVGCPRHVLPTVQGVRTRHGDGCNVMNFELDILRMIYLIILTFIVCYIPIQVVFIYEQVNGGLSDWPYYIIIRRYAFLLTCLPGAFHPILYGTMSKFYAKAFATLVSCNTK